MKKNMLSQHRSWLKTCNTNMDAFIFLVRGRRKDSKGWEDHYTARNLKHDEVKIAEKQSFRNQMILRKQEFIKTDFQAPFYIKNNVWMHSRPETCAPLPAGQMWLPLSANVDKVSLAGQMGLLGKTLQSHLFYLFQRSHGSFSLKEQPFILRQIWASMRELRMKVVT